MITLVPKPIATVARVRAGRVRRSCVTVVAAPPVSVSWVLDRPRVAPGVVVPVTVVVAPSIVAPEAGEVIVTGVEPGAPWVT